LFNSVKTPFPLNDRTTLKDAGLKHTLPGELDIFDSSAVAARKGGGAITSGFACFFLMRMSITSFQPTEVKKANSLRGIGFSREDFFQFQPPPGGAQSSALRCPGFWFNLLAAAFPAYASGGFSGVRTQLQWRGRAGFSPASLSRS
jgi:hypothetical protein